MNSDVAITFRVTSLDINPMGVSLVYVYEIDETGKEIPGEAKFGEDIKLGDLATITIIKMQVFPTGTRLVYRYQIDDHQDVGGITKIGESIEIMKHELKL